MPTTRRNSRPRTQPAGEAATKVTITLDGVAYRFLRNELELHADELSAAQARKKERTTVAIKQKHQWKQREDGVRQLLERI